MPTRGEPTPLPDPVRARALLDAVTSIASDLDLHSVLTRIVVSAATLTEARYGALGVVGGPDGRLVDFVTTGMESHHRDLVGDLPEGRGILRLLIDRAETITLEDLSAHPAAYGFPPHHPRMSTFLGVPVRVRGTVFGNLYLTTKSEGRPFTPEDELLVQSLARAAGFVIDNARTYGRSERRRQYLEAAAELTELLQPPVDLARAREQIVALARELAGSLSAALITLEPGQPAGITAYDGEPGHLAPELLRRVVDGLAGHDPGTGPVEAGWEGCLAVAIPLRAHLAGRGALVAVYDADQRTEDGEERDLLASFADQCALALDRAQALADRQDRAVVADRERIARDLHDVAVQRLFAAGLRLQALRFPLGESDALTRVDQVIEDLDLTIRSIRGTIFELQGRPPGSLRARVRALVDEYVPILGFAPGVQLDGPADTLVPPAVAEHLLAVLREALSNLARHAAARHGEVDILVSTASLRLTVRDDGRGLPPEITESGLSNVRRRAQELGGTLVVGARDPRGTELDWAVPLG